MRVAAASLVVLFAAPFAHAQEKAAADTEQPVERPATKLLKLLRAGEHAKLDKEIDALRASGREPRSWEDRLETAVETLSANRTLEKDLSRWCDQSPNSWGARLIRGKLRIGLAWDARGSGWAREVTEEGWRVFFARLNEAKKDLEQSYELEPKAPHAASAMLTVAMGLGDRAPGLQAKWFAKAVEADPKFVPAYEARLMHLMPKWGGTKEKLLSFARKPMDKDPADPALAILIVQAHEELGARNPAHFEDADVKKEMNEALKGLAEKYPGCAELYWTCANLAEGDNEAAVKWITKAAEAGSTSAMVQLWSYERGNGAEAAATKWLKKAAFAGDPLAQVQYGITVLNGSGSAPADEKGAVRWFERAAEAEHPAGLYMQAWSTLKGKGDVKKDPARGVDLLKKATVRGSAESAYLLSKLYEEGLDEDGASIVPKDAEASKKLLEIAARLGHPQARKELEGR